MDHPTPTARRRSLMGGGRGLTSTRLHHTFRRAVGTFAAAGEACRSLGRRLVGSARVVMDAATTAADLVAFAWSRRPAPVPIPIDASSAKIRRSRMIHRR